MRLILLALAPLVGQGAGGQGPVASRPRPAAPPPPVAARTASAPASRPIDAWHARVRVVLTNGQKLTGIVKRNRYAERAEGFDFFPAAKTDPAAGLRLWFANPGQNYLFISHKEIESIVSLGFVTELEIRDLEAQAEAEALAARERDGAERLAALRSRIKALDAEREGAETSDEAKKKADETKAKSEALEKAKRLVDRFPPEQGWNQDRRDAILAKKTNHLYPTPEELEFVKLFGPWKEALELLETSKNGSGEKEEKPGEGPKDHGGKPGGG
jgi:hypothetical protein